MYYLIQCTCVYACFYIVLLFKETYMWLIYVMTFIATLLTHSIHLKPTHTTKPVPNLPVSRLNTSQSVLQYNMNTISPLYLFFCMQVHSS